MTCEEITALLTLAPVCGARPGTGAEAEPDEVLSADEAARLDGHLSGCEACREVAAALTNAYRGLDEAIEERTTMQPMTTDLRERTLAAVRDTLAHDAEPAQKKEPAAAPEPGPDPRAVDAIGKKIALACSYCHDRATRDEVLFCASCLAPHHRECFETHGTCTLPGCGETRTVRPADAPSFAGPSSRRRRNWLAIPMLLGVAVASAVAALAARTGAKAFMPPPTPNVAVPSPEDTDLPPPSPERPQPPSVKELPVAPPTPTPKLEAGLMDTDTPPTIDKIDVDVENVGLADVMDIIGRRVGRTILVDPTVQENVTVSLREIPWREAVDVIARMARCEVEERAGGILVLTQPAKVTIHYTDANLRTILQLLAAYSGKNLILGPDVTGTFTVDLKDMNWWRALEIVAEHHKLHLTRCKGDTVIVTTAPLDPEILAGLPLEVAPGPARDPGPRLWLDAVSADLSAVAERLARLAGANLIVEASLDERVTLSLLDVPFRDALDAVARGSSCRVEERPGGILVLTALRSGSLDAADCPVRPLLQLLAAAKGWNAIIDGNIRGEVTVSLENVDFFDAAVMTLAPLGIAASVDERDHVFAFKAVKSAGAPTIVEVAPAEDARLGALIAEVARLARTANRATDPSSRAALATELEARQAELRAWFDGSDEAPATPQAPVEALGAGVQAILCSEVRRAAVINGVVYGPGESLLDAQGEPAADAKLAIKVVKIERGAVTFRQNEVEFTRSLGE